MSVCACASLWYVKYLWHVYQRVQNVKMVSVYLCVHVCVCVCGVPNIKLIKCKKWYLSVCASVCVCACVCVWYVTYKLSIFAMFANESKSAKCEFF